MRIRVEEIVRRAIEAGIGIGWARAHKHVDQPDRSVVEDQIDRAIWEKLDEVLIFNDDPEPVT